MITQYYGTPRDKRAIRLRYDDSSLVSVLICEKKKTEKPRIELHLKSDSQNYPFNPDVVNLVGAYRGFSNQITEEQFLAVFEAVSECLLE